MKYVCQQRTMNHHSTINVDEVIIKERRKILL